jgi:pseudaminic acid cytidylyltransferase
MSRLCVIPARGGSKRIPRKNVRAFAGQPIIAWSIRAALDSGLFDTVMVSTDDAEIANAARAAGAVTPFMRTAQTSNDQAGIMEVLAEVAASYEAEGQSFDTLCCLLATAPLTTPGRLAEGAALMDQGAEAVVPVAPFDYPIQRALRRAADGRVAMMDPVQLVVRSQDLEPAWHDAGQFYWTRWAAARSGRSVLAGDAYGLPLSSLECQDIDTEDDWALAELKFQRLRDLGRL